MNSFTRIEHNTRMDDHERTLTTEPIATDELLLDDQENEVIAEAGTFQIVRQASERTRYRQGV